MFNFKKKKNKKKLLYKNRKKQRIKNPIIFNIKQLDPRAITRFTINNIFLNIACRMQKKPNLYSNLYWVSCGSQKFSKPQYRGSTKTTYVSNYAFGNILAQKLKFLKFNKPVTLVMKGAGRYFKSFLKSFRVNYNKKFGILDLTPIALNGCRASKKRRV